MIVTRQPSSEPPLPRLHVKPHFGGSGNIATARTLTTLWSFSGTNGENPLAGLALGSDGNFYGTTDSGGSNYDGTVFRISSAGTLTTLYQFGGGSNGVNPYAGLLQGIDTNFYGTTYSGGTGTNCPGGCGTVFQITPSGSLTTLYSFRGALDGANPRAGLVQGVDTNFYGTTANGGMSTNCPGGCGTVFQITPAGTLTTLYQFGGGSNGVNPYAGLWIATDSNLYGTTYMGGTNGDGTVFRISSEGTVTTLYQFGGVATDGQLPQAGLWQGSDGNFYGTTSRGGTNGEGTVFRISSAGTFTTLWQFGFAPLTNGLEPYAALVEGSDGNYYGTTYVGGTNGYGTVFRITPAGTLTTLYQFGGVATDGWYPKAWVVQGLDGNFYGTTAGGGSNGNYGTVFQLIVPLNPPPNQISAVQLSGTNVVITIPTIAGVTYQLQFSSSLGPTGNWANVGSPVTSSGGSQSLTGSGGNPRSNGFYRAEGSWDPNNPNCHCHRNR